MNLTALPKTKNHIGYQNRKTEVFCNKNRKTDLKNSQNRKTENSNAPLQKVLPREELRPPVQRLASPLEKQVGLKNSLLLEQS